ncbi:MAG: DUF3394 domain-containing protein, partial [Burkholderiales bacterium]|nr:DUF3394 domain-containing protein [Burkholderiales bacterium]
VPAARIFEVAERLGENDRLVLLIKGTTIEGDDVRKTVAVQLTQPGPGRKRLEEAGITVVALGDQVQISNVRFGSRAKKSGFEIGWDVGGVMVPNEGLAMHWVYLPAYLLIALIWWLQGRRMPADPSPGRRTAPVKMAAS